MPKFKPLTAADVTFTIAAEPEDMPIDMHSGDPDYIEQDQELERKIARSLNSGNEYAWCIAVVTANYTDPKTGISYVGRDTLGGVACLHDDDRDMSAEACFNEIVRDYGMQEQALKDLNTQLAAAHAIKVVRACKTRYVGPSDTRGSRVIATHLTTGKRAIVSWDHALDADENHATAAEKCLGARPDTQTSINGGGYVFTVDPSRIP